MRIEKITKKRMQQLEVFPLLILPSVQTRTTQPALLHIILLFAHSPPLYSFFFHLNSPSTSGFYWEKGGRGKLTDALYSWLHMHREEGKRAPAFRRAFIMFQNEKETSLFQCRMGWGTLKFMGSISSGLPCQMFKLSSSIACSYTG